MEAFAWFIHPNEIGRRRRRPQICIPYMLAIVYWSSVFVGVVRNTILRWTFILMSALSGGKSIISTIILRCTMMGLTLHLPFGPKPFGTVPTPLKYDLVVMQCNHCTQSCCCTSYATSDCSLLVCFAPHRLIVYVHLDYKTSHHKY